MIWVIVFVWVFSRVIYIRGSKIRGWVLSSLLGVIIGLVLWALAGGLIGQLLPTVASVSEIYPIYTAMPNEDEKTRFVLKYSCDKDGRVVYAIAHSEKDRSAIVYIPESTAIIDYSDKGNIPSYEKVDKKFKYKWFYLVAHDKLFYPKEIIHMTNDTQTVRL